jgi:Na+/H+ antiporter NhaC
MRNFTQEENEKAEGLKQLIGQMSNLDVVSISLWIIIGVLWYEGTRRFTYLRDILQGVAGSLSILAILLSFIALGYFVYGLKD